MIKSLCKLKKKPLLLNKHLVQLDPTLIRTAPLVALGQAKEEILRIGLLTIEALESTNYYLSTNKKKLAIRTYEIKEVVNTTSNHVSDFLHQFKVVTLAGRLSEEQKILLNIVSIIRNIFDHIDGIWKKLEFQTQKKIFFSQDALTDIQEMATFVIMLLQEALKAFDFKDIELASNVLHEREVIKVKAQWVVQSHEQRVRRHFCMVSASTDFLTLLDHLAGIRDRAAEISYGVLEDSNK